MGGGGSASVAPHCAPGATRTRAVRHRRDRVDAGRRGRDHAVPIPELVRARPAEPNLGAYAPRLAHRASTRIRTRVTDEVSASVTSARSWTHATSPTSTACRHSTGHAFRSDSKRASRKRRASEPAHLLV